MAPQQLPESRFIHWYDSAKSVLGELMPDRSEEMMKLCNFNNDVMVLPLPRETTKVEISGRVDPSICIIDHPDRERMEIVLQCNTLKSVEKLRNILDSHQLKEKADLIQGLSKLDEDFRTLVYSKQKPYNFGQSPQYVQDRTYISRTISEKEIDQLFARVDEIRSEGVEQKLREGRRDPPELPAIGLACVSLLRDENLFRRKLEQIKPIYIATLSVKTQSELRKVKRAEEEEKRLDAKLRAKTEPAMQIAPEILCADCKDRKYSREEYNESHFCRNCGKRLTFVH